MARHVHYLIRGAIMLGLALYILYLVKTGLISYYIAPRMAPFVKASAIILYLTAAHQFYLALLRSSKADQPRCDCHPLPTRFTIKNSVTYGLFSLPLFFALLLPDAMLGSAMADQKGMRLSAQASNPAFSPPPAPESPSTGFTEEKPVIQEAEINLDELFPSDMFTEVYAKYAKSVYHQETIKVDEHSYTEILTAVDLYLAAFQGKQIEITGFVYRTDQMEDHQFAVGRFAMTCCSADASPYGVFSEYSRAKQLKDDEWVTVRGTIGKTQFNEMEIMKINVTSIRKAAAPSEPYVYPNFDFGSGL